MAQSVLILKAMRKNIYEVYMNKLKFIIDVVDKIIAVARLIGDAAELRKKEIEDDSEEES
jgi:hypothetical protein